MQVEGVGLRTQGTFVRYQSQQEALEFLGSILTDERGVATEITVRDYQVNLTCLCQEAVEQTVVREGIPEPDVTAIGSEECSLPTRRNGGCLVAPSLLLRGRSVMNVTDNQDAHVCRFAITPRHVSSIPKFGTTLSGARRCHSKNP